MEYNMKYQIVIPMYSSCTDGVLRLLECWGLKWFNYHQLGADSFRCSTDMHMALAIGYRDKILARFPTATVRVEYYIVPHS